MSFLVELPQSEYNLNAFARFAPTGGFDNDTALAMAWMSQLAYETRLPDKISAISASFGLSEVHILQQPVKSTLPLSDTRGIIANKDNALIIAFAGTDPLKLLNWVSDFYLGQPSADVHEGFQDAAAAVWPVVGAAIERCMEDVRDGPQSRRCDRIGDRGPSTARKGSGQCSSLRLRRAACRPGGFLRTLQCCVRVDNLSPCPRKGYCLHRPTYGAWLPPRRPIPQL
jgi:hypothetical protein